MRFCHDRRCWTAEAEEEEYCGFTLPPLRGVIYNIFDDAQRVPGPADSTAREWATTWHIADANRQTIFTPPRPSLIPVQPSQVPVATQAQGRVLYENQWAPQNRKSDPSVFYHHASDPFTFRRDIQDQFRTVTVTNFRPATGSDKSRARNANANFHLHWRMAQLGEVPDDAHVLKPVSEESRAASRAAAQRPHVVEARAAAAAARRSSASGGAAGTRDRARRSSPSPALADVLVQVHIGGPPPPTPRPVASSHQATFTPVNQPSPSPPVQATVPTPNSRNLLFLLNSSFTPPTPTPTSSSSSSSSDNVQTSESTATLDASVPIQLPLRQARKPRVRKVSADLGSPTGAGVKKPRQKSGRKNSPSK